MAGKGTPALSAARAAGIDHRVHEYVHDPDAGAYGVEAAENLGVDPARVFKTLVVSVDGVLTVAVLPVEARLDLRALGKRAALADAREAQRATGYVAGGISPLGQRSRLPTVVDESVLTVETVFVSAGRRGLEVELAPVDLLALTGGTVRAITRA